MTERRFTDKPELDPESVYSLPPGHLALQANRTLFPTTVVDVNDEFTGRLLVSGKNNRKLGETIIKGKFSGYHLYGLSLEERATCPIDCDARAFCYGNGMHMARRHRIDDMNAFCAFIEDEVQTILADPIAGLMVRLHVLGDFPSVEYVAFWADMLAEHDRLACFGYTHRKTKNWGGDETGDAIQSVKDNYPDRFRIRWSGRALRPDSATIIDYVPDRPRVEEGLVCPAQTDATACCASCGLCWEAKHENIAFIKHGPKSDEAAAESVMAASISTPKSIETQIGAAVVWLRRYALKLCKDATLAEDIAQETVLKALANLDKFDGLNLSAWLTTICKNHFLTSVRKSSREIADIDGKMAEALSDEGNAESSLDLQDALGVLGEMSETHRSVIMERAEGASYDEIAAKAGVPVGTVKSRISRARETFGEMLGGTAASAEENAEDDVPPLADVSSDAGEVRAIRPIRLPPSIKPKAVSADVPMCRNVDPRSLLIEAKYQRDLSGRSMRLIKKIIAGWDWTKFKPPVCAETQGGLFVIDGQHTVIAAASHPGINQVPVLIVSAQTIEKRAAAFVSHNRDRLVMTPAQVFYGEVAAGNPDVKEILAAVLRAGASIPRLPIQRKAAKPGQITAIGELRKGFSVSGVAVLERVIRIAVLSRVAPVSLTVIRAIRAILTEKRFSELSAYPDQRIADAISSIKNIEAMANHFGAETGQSRDRACAGLIANVLKPPETMVAAE